MAEQQTDPDFPQGPIAQGRLDVGLDALEPAEEADVDLEAELETPTPNLLLRMALPFFRIVFPDLDEVQPNRPVPASPNTATAASSDSSPTTELPDSTITIIRWNFKFLACLIVMVVTTVIGIRALHRYQVPKLAAAMLVQSEVAGEAGLESQQQKYLGRYVALSPHDTEALVQLSQLQQQTANTRGDYLTAYRLLKRICGRDAAPDESRRDLIRLAIALEEYPEALEQLETMRRRFPRDAELSLLTGRSLERQQEYAAAATSYERAIELDPRRIEAYAPLVNLLDRQLGRTLQCVELLDQLVNANPQSLHAYLSRAAFRLRRGDYRAAAGDVQTARTIAAESLELDLLEARLVVVLGAGAPWSPDDVTQRLEQRLDEFPENARLYAALAEMMAAANRPGEAETLLRRGLARQPGNFDLRVRLIALLIDVNDTSGAETQMTQLGDSTIDGSQVQLANHCFRGYLALRAERWVPAVLQLEAVRRQVHSIPILERSIDLWLATAYRSLRQHELEVVACRRAVETDPASIAARQGLAKAFATEGRYDDALAHLRIVGDAPGVPLSIARLLVEKNLSLAGGQRDWPSVTRAINAAERAGADIADVTLLRARRAELAGRPQRARNMLKAATDKNPEAARYWAALAALDRRQRGNAACRERLATAEKIHPQSVELWQVRIDCAPPTELAKLESGLARFSNDQQVVLLRRLAVAHRRQEQFEETSRLLNRAMSLRPSDLELSLLAFEAALNADDGDGCEAALAQVAEIEGTAGPHVQSGRIAMLVAEAERGRPADINHAATMLAALKQNDSRRPYLMMLEARVLELQGKRSQAAERSRRALQAGTTNVNVLLRLARHHLQQQDIETADTLMRTYAGQMDLQSTPVLLATAAELAMRAGDAARALTHARRWVEIDADNDRAHLQLGRLLLNAAENDAALESIRRATELKPESKAASLLLLELLLRMGKIGDAEREVGRMANHLTPSDAPLLFADYYEKTGQAQQAADVYMAIVANDQSQPQQLLAAAEYFLRTKATDVAEPVLRKMTAMEVGEKLTMPLRGQTGEAAERKRARLKSLGRGHRLLARLLAARDYPQYLEGLRLLDAEPGEEAATDDLLAKAELLAVRPYANNRREAISILETLAETDEGLPQEADLLLAQLYDLNGESMRAERQWQRLVTNDEDDSTVITQYIHRCIEHGQLEEASDRMRRFMRRDVDVEVRFSIEARLMAHTGPLETLRSYVDEWVKAASTAERRSDRLQQAAGLLDNASAELEKSDRERAEAVRRESERWYRKAAASGGESGQLSLAGFLTRTERSAEAFEICRTVQANVSAELLAPLLIALVRAGEMTEQQTGQIEQWLEAATRTEPKSAHAWRQHAVFCYLQGRPDEAERFYRRALELKPEGGVLLNNLAWQLAVVQQRPKEAEPLIGRAIAANGPEPYLLDTQAVVLLVIGQPSKAVELLKDAVATAESATARLHLAWAYQQLENRSLAAVEFRRATALGLTESSLEPAERPNHRQLAEWLKDD